METEKRLIDIGEVKRHIKPKADSTLLNMRKTDLIEYIRCLENNYNVAVSFNENQAKYIESLGVSPVVHGQWIPIIDEPTPLRNFAMIPGYECSVCGRYEDEEEPYCNCGAKMDGDGNE